MNYDTSILSEWVTKKGNKFYCTRFNGSMRYIGCFEAVSDGTRNPDMSRLYWKPIMDVEDGAKYVGDFTSTVNNNVYKLWIGAKND